MPIHKKILWRIIKEPLIFFTFVSWFQFLIQYRFQRLQFLHSHVPTLWLLLHYGFLYFYVSPQLAILDFVGLLVGLSLGFLLFHWQHEVNRGYWVPKEEYYYKDSCLLASTYLIVPFFYKWATLGIEYHHIHHTSTKVPCYQLQTCHEEAPQELWSPVQVVGYRKAFAGAFNTMYNLKTRRFEPFDIYKLFLSLISMENDN